MPDASGPWGGPPDRPSGRERRRDGSGWRATARAAAIPALLVASVLAGIVVDLRAPTGFSYLRDLYVAPSLRATVRRDPRDGHATVAVVGRIGAAAGPWFYELVKDRELRRGDTVLLSSPGGNLEAALVLGRTIRAHGLETAVGRLSDDGTIEPSFCASACVFAFAGGVTRRLASGSRLGVHRFTLVSSGGEDAATASQRTLGQILGYLADMDVKSTLAEAATKSDDVRWLDPAEARAMGLVTP